MKKRYENPVMYVEAFITEQYVAANDCGKHVGVPSHGHFKNSAGEIHCAFTSSNCGTNATSCQDTNGRVCSTFKSQNHITITYENGKIIQKPNSSSHNCHVLSTNEAAQNFAKTYTDENCGSGVAKLMGLNGFTEIDQAFS